MNDGSMATSTGSRRRDTFLQRRVGDGGSLWVVVPRHAPGGGRSYTLTFRFTNCHSRDYQGSRWPFAVVGDPYQSQLFRVQRRPVAADELAVHARTNRSRVPE